MRLGGCEQCQLFLAVYPAFVEALPIISTSSNIQSTDTPVSTYTLSLDNLITELRDEVKKIGIIFNEEDARCELRDELFQDARNALDQILFFFEDLVHDGITDKSPTIYGYEQLLQTFPKLVRLKHEISNEYTRTTFDMISFGTEPRLYHRAISTAQLFNRHMRRIYSSVGGVASGQSYRDVQPHARDHLASLAQAKRISEASRLLFSFLERKVCHETEGKHEGHLRLSGFDQAELDMMLSICGHAGKWQQAYFRLADEKMEKKIVDCLCPLLKQSLRLRQPTQMMFDERGIYKFVIRKDRPKSRRAPSKETLGDILRGEERGRQKTPSHRTLKHNKKRGLGVEIATALLHLFGSPLLQARVLDANSIYILRDEDAAPEAYISFCLSSNPAEGTVSDVEAEDGDPSLLALAVILLELELEREITPCNEDIDELSGQPSLYVAATRHHGELEDNVDANFFGIIEECLQLDPNGEARLQGHWCDWAGKSTHPIDEDAQQHGTSTAALLLRVARHAEVFVGRVAKDQKHLNGATNNIVDAISHAATVWDVDIVTMSFGFNKRITAIEEVIRDVIGKRRNEGRDILFFAAANNDGLNSHEMFPASDLNVISVRGTNHTGEPLQEYSPSPWPQKVFPEVWLLGRDPDTRWHHGNNHPIYKDFNI
ncbi:hypothetical protein CDV36_003673 [Fusarium kuroshium]|uniref:Uncharacterized protein n=2 Tax=Fusarium solani species complex TaxID=232080 RepID=A0A3M2SHP7_9HYPO|nr:hypothetical protein CDV36_003673 [Fusarium kuroshium]